MKARTRAAATLLTPFFVLFTVVMLIPIGYAVWLSLFTEQQSGGLGFGGSETVFTGLGNYTAALGDRVFRDGFLVLLGYCVVYIPLMVGGASRSRCCSTRRSPAPSASSSSRCSCRTPCPASSPR